MVTRSPSFTARSVTRPMVSALMLTSRFGWILPEADTIASRCRFLTGSVVTLMPSVRLNLTLANAIAPRTSTTPTPMMIFLFRLKSFPLQRRLMIAATTTAMTAYTTSSDMRDRLRAAAIKYRRSPWRGRSATR